MTNFYGTVAGADTYHAERGNAAWAEGSESDREQALLRAAEYLDRAYRSGFPGYPVDGRLQDREWPRADAIDIYGYGIPADEIPIEIQHAAYEVALRELENPGSLDPDVIPGERRKSVSVSGAVSVTYAAAFGPDAQRPMSAVIAGTLRRILTGNRSGSMPLAGQSVRI